MREEELLKKQLELQKDSVDELEKKLNEQLKKSHSKNRVYDTTIKKYIEPISNDLEEIRKEALPTALAKILKNHKEFIYDLYIEEFTDFEKYSALKESIEKRDIKDYLVEDLSDYLVSQVLLGKKDKDLKKEILNFLKPYFKEFDKTIDEFRLQQKQALSLFSSYLTSKELTFLTFRAISKLMISKDSDEDDKTHPTSEQEIIKEIGENLFNEVSFRIKEKIEELENDHILEMASEIFIIFEHHNIIEKTEENSSLDLYRFSEEFLNKSKKIIENIIKFTPPFFKPMIVKPLEWKSVDDGGFLKDESVGERFNLLIQKHKTKREKKRILKQKETISKDFLKAINILQSTKWQINKDLLRVVDKFLEKEIKRAKEELKQREKDTKEQKREFNQKIKELKEQIKSSEAEANGKIEMARELIDNEDEFEKKLIEIENRLKESKKILYKEIRELKLKKLELTKDIKDRLKKLELQKRVVDIAKEFKDFDEIYFVYQVDFRGRVYPVQALLQPQGDDLSKSLLCFSKKLPLENSGLFWLKVHGANCYGVDKVSFDERIKWVDKNVEQIVRVAKRDEPFEDDFLKNADEPFKFLAFCFEYSRYLEDPDNFQSSLPVAIDGSNNGFQHISTLLYDTNGAKKVNVLPNDEDTPADIYKEVALKLKELMDDELKEKIGEIYEKIDRSFVKKGVMTDSYGAGKNAKAYQIEEFIKDNFNIDIKDLRTISKEIAVYLDKAIDEIAPSSAIYKNWMKNIAKLISAQNKPIVWHTPIIGFKVIQAEYKTKTDRIVTNFNGRKNSIQIRKETDEISKKDQTKGIAPNFIHSLDATHLYLTILNAFKNGIDSFATVHDSFATHASKVELLSKILKDEFIELAKYGVLKHFQDEITKEYNLEISPKKRKGFIQDIANLFVDNDFDIEKIKESKYFFA